VNNFALPYWRTEVNLVTPSFATTGSDEMIDSTDTEGSNTASLPPLNGLPPVLSPSVDSGESGSHSGAASKIARPMRAIGDGRNSGLGQSDTAGWRVPAEPGGRLAAAFRNRFRLYRKQLHLCQEDFSEHSVHQLRVATRRFIAQFVLLGRVAPGARTEKARKTLKRRLKLLGQLRDVQVQRSFIAHHWPRYPELVLVLDFISWRERRLIKTLLRKIQGFKVRKLEKFCAGLCAELGTISDNPGKKDVVASHAYGAMAEAFAEVARRRQAIDPGNSQTIHRTRVAFKRFRYIVESLSPAFTGLRRHRLRPFATYQRRMGLLQDLEILQAFIGGFVKDNPGTEPLLRPFIRYLKRRRARALRSVVRHADDLFVFWRLAGLDQSCAGTLSRSAA
jgi:CHAD domain-containing protein